MNAGKSYNTQNQESASTSAPTSPGSRTTQYQHAESENHRWLFEYYQIPVVSVVSVVSARPSGPEKHGYHKVFQTMTKRPSAEPKSDCTVQPEDPRDPHRIMTSEESQTLKEIMKGSTESFFDEVWQRKCGIFRRSASDLEGSRPEEALCKDGENPLKALIFNGWPILIDLMEQGRNRLEQSDDSEFSSDLLPLIFQAQRCLSQPNVYANNISMAYLDGCSVVLNHSDTLNGYIATLCQDLQKSFPHAYANSYITPPSSKAVPPHADDRDVLVIQVVGKKHWKVYQIIPIPFPYPHEQVGKEGMPIPPPVLDGPCLFDGILNAGDVLYMPRGYVHEARTQEEELSFHVTVALATHDWTLAGVMQSATSSILSRVVDYRMALPVPLGRGESEQDRSKLQSQINEAIERLRHEVTAETVCQQLRLKYDKHNHSKHLPRQAAIERLKASSTISISVTSLVVGRQAAANVTLLTRLRCATTTEKASLPSPKQPQGLHVREELADAVLGILHRMKTEEGIICSVKDLPSLLSTDLTQPHFCQLTILSLAKCCVELGALAIVTL